MVSKKTLASIILAGALGLTCKISGCSKYEYIIGTVEKEVGSLTQIVESKEAFSAKELYDLIYILQIKTENGETYTASIEPYLGRREALALALKEGDRVRFVVNGPQIGRSFGFGNDKVGRIYADQIEILQKE